VLAPDDRSVLLDLLRPPPDSVLEVAVATTFTLGLDAALVAPLAFASFDAAGPGDPIAALEAIRSVAGRLTVFCQAGEMRVPSAASDLFGFLGSVVYEVHRPRAGALFHPKLWLLGFAADGVQSTRLLVPTRNLTSEASWDAVLRLDGTVDGVPKSSNRPLVDLVRWCTGHTTIPLDSTRQAGIDSLLEAVRRTRWELPEGVGEVIFHALGLGGRTRPDFSGRRQLVISPFVNADGLRIVAPTPNAIVVARAEQLGMLPVELVKKLDCRCITSVGGDEDDADHAGGESTPSLLGDLHAKIVVTERDRQAHLFVGSANATGAAFGGNVEILVELVGGTAALGINAVLGDLAKVLEPCLIEGGRVPTEADELQRVLDDLLRDAAVAQLELRAVADNDDGFRIEVTSGAPLLPAGHVGRGSVELLTRRGYAIEVPTGERMTGEFAGVPLADVTPFVVLRVQLCGVAQQVEGAAVIRARLLCDPPGRLDAVIARLVDSPAKFLRFLFLLLGLANGGVPPWFQPSADGSGLDHGSRLIELGVFEAVMRALVAHPASLDALGRLVERLRATDAGRSTLPDGFEELWASVTEARLPAGARS
jgi:hypothetical protein